MRETDISYFQRRMAEEARLGEQSREQSAGVAHRRLATMYRQKIEAIEKASSRPPIYDPI
jgi:hypothetical protein